MKRAIIETSKLSLAFACFAVGAFFHFALEGYITTAFLFYGIGVVILIYLGLGILSRRREKAAKALRRILTALITVGIIYFAAVEIIIVKNSRTDEGSADYLIVLGAGVNGTVPSLSLRDRLEAALDYLNGHPETKAVVSGGQGEFEEITEAECMYVWLTERGIPKERIIKEDRAMNTAENIVFSLELIRARSEKENPSIAVLSSEYHLYRAKETARKGGVSEPLGVAAKTSLPVLKINYFVREAFAVTAMWVFGA